MNVTHRIENNCLIIYFEGDLALDGVPQAEKYLFPLLEHSSFKGVLVNLRKTRYIDSQGISLIIVTYRKMIDESKKFVMCNLDGEQSTLLKSLAIDKVIPLINGEAEALTFLEQNEAS